jgi:hypothetical protein
VLVNAIAANIYESLKNNSGISNLLTDVLDPHTKDKVLRDSTCTRYQYDGAI